MSDTYIKVYGAWKYLYRAIDSSDQTLDFLLRTKRDALTAKRFLQKALRATHRVESRVINVDKIRLTRKRWRN
jgi:transposase-like protein